MATFLIFAACLLATSTLAPAASVPAPPSDPRFAQVFGILDTYCASCHQAGRLKAPEPGGGFANVLALDEIAADPHVVRPGLPDGSPLYHVLLDRHRPYELPADLPWPSAAEIQRVRTYIDELPAASPVCALQEKPITPDAVASAVDIAVREAGEVAGRDLRFVTLAHFANACASEAELDGYRQAVAKTLNSLSWGQRPVQPRRVDAAGTLLAFRLADLGWIDEHWEALASLEPAGVALDLKGRLKSPGAHPRPMRADFLVNAAFSPGLYQELLGLPQTLDELVRLLGIPRDADAGTVRAPRAGIKDSSVVRGPRVIERFQAEQRRLWLAYDFADGGGERDIFERPLGAVRAANERYKFKADGLRALFTLPNGYLGFAAFDPNGRRLAQVPASIETPGARSIGRGTSAACVSCHNAGPAPFTDQMRASLLADRAGLPKDARDAALSIYPAPTDWQKPLDDDAFRFRRALIQTGIDPDRLIHGLEPTAALARRYRLDVDLRTLAAEAGLTVAELEQVLRNAPSAEVDPSYLPRLRQGGITRSDANRVLAVVRGRPVAAAARAPHVGSDAEAAEPLRLAIWSDAARYKAGDLLTVHASATAACHLTLISIDAKGKATVLFPSEFEPENLLLPNRALAVPAPGSAYQFRLNTPGSEQVVGLCQTNVRLPSGIEPDYERQRFTVLGNYENFERTAFRLDGEAARSTRAAGRGRTAASREARPEARSERGDATARAAIRLTIE